MSIMGRADLIARKAMAMIVIALMLMPPVAAQFPFAINVVQWSGQDGIDRFARPNDLATMTVEVIYPGSLDPDDLRIYKTPVYYETAQDCEPLELNKNRCTYQEQLVNRYGTLEYDLRLFAPPPLVQQLASTPATLKVDSEPPRVITFTVNPQITRSGQFVVSYKAEDYGTLIGQPTNCVGVKTFDILADANIITQIGGNLGQCSLSGFQSLTLSPDETGFREIALCGQAKDYFDRPSLRRCQYIFVDKAAPRLVKVELLDQNGIALTHVRPDTTIVVDIVATIQGDDVQGEDDIVETTVKAILEDVNPTLVGLRPFDTRQGDELFIWENIPLTTPETCAVTIKARDKLGNLAEKRFPCALKLDGVGPRVVKLETGIVKDGLPLLGIGHNIIVHLEEKDNQGNPGAGLDKLNVFLDLSEIGRGSTVQANRCEQSTATPTLWTCTWENIASNVASGNYRVRVHPTATADDIGNALAEPFETDIIYDRDAPQIELESMEVIHGLEEYGDVIVRGDSLEFKIKATDFVEGKADFSQIGAGEQLLRVEECGSLNGGTSRCVFSGTVLASGPRTATISFTFVDEARNTATLDHTIEVFRIIDDPEPNYWKVDKLQCTPRLIDRATAELIDQKVFCEVFLEPIEGASPTIRKIAQPKVGDCSGDLEFLRDVTLYNPNSPRPSLGLILAPAKYEVDEVKLSCPITLTSQIGKAVTVNPEQEPLNITLQFYNTPQGELFESLKAEAEEAHKEARETLEWVGTLQSIFDYAETGCKIKTIITQILTVLHTVYKIVAGQETYYRAAALATPPPANAGFIAAQQTASSLRQMLCQLETDQDIAFFGIEEIPSIFNFVDMLCSMVNCQFAPERYPDIEVPGFIGVLTGAGPYPPGVLRTLCTGQGFDALMDYRISKGWEGAGMPDITPIQVKDSVVWSAACLCVPGIIYNLNKYRQIQCKYALCLEEVLDTGLPISICKDLTYYLTCNFIVSDAIFNSIPFSSVYNTLVGIIQEAFVNPFVGVQAILGWLCKDMCKMQMLPSGVPGYIDGFDWCVAPKLISKVGDAIGSITSILESDFWDVGNDWCEELTYGVEEEEEED